jgi:uncharacterized repeat protein (TIGR01451 family)
MTIVLALIGTAVASAAAAASPGDLHLASINARGDKATWSVSPAVSGDGSRVAFVTISPLDPRDTDEDRDIYVKDVPTGELILASTSATGVKGNFQSDLPAISADGNRVAFISGSTNLHPTAKAGVFVKDLTSGEVLLASSRSDGTPADGPGWSPPSLSADGSRVAFAPAATNLDPRDTDDIADVYVKDLHTGELFLASTSSAGVKANGADLFEASGAPFLSADGANVAFVSGGANLHPHDTDSSADVFVKDLRTGQLALASTSAEGVKGDAASFSPSLVADGSTIAFRSYSSNLVPGFSGGGGQVFVKDLTTGAIRPVSTAADGTRANRGAADPTISADGATVAFGSGATNLHPADADELGDVFVKDLRTGAVELASASTSGIKGNAVSYQISLAAGGRAVAFRSDASNLDPADEDTAADVYVKELGGSLPSPAQSADLSVRQTDAPDPVPAGQPVTYRIAVANAGPSAATGVVLVDELPAGTDFHGASASQGAGCTRDGGLLRCALGGIAAGAAAEVTVTVAPQGLGYLTNTVSVRADQSDSHGLDNVSRINTNVDPAADVAASLSDAPDPATVRQTIAYTISVLNHGPTWAGVDVVYEVPENVRVHSVSGENCQTGRDRVTCTIFGIPDGQQASIRVTVEPRRPGTLVNRVTLTGHQFDPDRTNDTATETTVVTR